MSFEKESEEELKSWKPPSSDDIERRRRIFQIEEWIRSGHRFVTDEEIIAYAEKAFRVQRKTAKDYLKSVISDFRRNGIAIIGA